MNKTMSIEQQEAQGIICATNNQPSIIYHSYDQIYPFTTENIPGYMQDVADKEILVVGSSGDHKLNALNLGAKTVDTFDINCLTKLYTELKEEIIKNFIYEDFLSFLNNSYPYYVLIREKLLPETRKFWDWYFQEYIDSKSSIYNTRLFHTRYPIEDYERLNNYFNNLDYEKLRNRLCKGYNGTNYYTDVHKLPSLLTKKYDQIYLSSIIGSQAIYSKFINTVLKLYEKLKNNGELYYGYFFQGTSDMINDYLKELPSTEVREIPSAKSHGTDKVLVLRK